MMAKYLWNKGRSSSAKQRQQHNRRGLYLREPSSVWSFGLFLAWNCTRNKIWGGLVEMERVDRERNFPEVQCVDNSREEREDDEQEQRHRILLHTRNRLVNKTQKGRTHEQHETEPTMVEETLSSGDFVNNNASHKKNSDERAFEQQPLEQFEPETTMVEEPVNGGVQKNKTNANPSRSKEEKGIRKLEFVRNLNDHHKIITNFKNHYVVILFLAKNKANLNLQILWDTCCTLRMCVIIVINLFMNSKFHVGFYYPCFNSSFLWKLNCKKLSTLTDDKMKHVIHTNCKKSISFPLACYNLGNPPNKPLEIFLSGKLVRYKDQNQASLNIKAEQVIFTLYMNLIYSKTYLSAFVFYWILSAETKEKRKREARSKKQGKTKEQGGCLVPTTSN